MMPICPTRSAEQKPPHTVVITPPTPVSNKGNTATPPVEEVLAGSQGIDGHGDEDLTDREGCRGQEPGDPEL